MTPAFFVRAVFCFLKRSLKKPLYILLLLLFPLMTVFFLYSDSEESRLNVALYTQSDNDFSQEIVSKLVSRDGVYHFYSVPSEDALYQDVLSGHAECGYIFPENLLDQLNLGRKKNLVDLIVSSSTTMSKITNEIVYSELFELYSLRILEDYLIHDSLLENPDPEQIESLYQKYLTNGSTFAFDITGAYQDYTSVRKGLTLHMFIGLVGILILLGGLSGLLQYTEDEQKKRHEHVPFSQKKYIAFLQITCPLLLFFIAGAISLAIAGYFTEPSFLLRYLCYGLLTLIFCMLLYPLRRFRMMLLTFLPLYLLGCLIFTPVFIDLSLYLPKLAWISRIFITYYLF